MGYGELYDSVHARLAETSRLHTPFIIRLLRDQLAIKPWLQVVARSALRLYQARGIRRLMCKHGLLSDALVPDRRSGRPLRACHDSKTEARCGKVALFTACLSNLVDNQIHPCNCV